ncbi:MAG: hypothetical protein K8R58_00745 [Bacteroidales bacterium]|nr:hypothetical protein [Bacteroidales bacterium]
MAYFIHYKDPNSPEIEKILNELPKCPGTCIFVDIVNSTDIKYKTRIKDWGRKLNNTFNFISFLNDFPENIVKGIGDEIMLFIPDNALFAKKTYNDYYSLLEEIYATIDNIKNFPLKDLFLNCKVSIHYCTEVYNITFLEGYNDYYGSDIDLTARLMLKGKANRIVLSEKFYKKVRNDLKRLNIQKQKTCIKFISSKYIEDFKGVPKLTELRVIDV